MFCKSGDNIIKFQSQGVQKRYLPKTIKGLWYCSTNYHKVSRLYDEIISYTPNKTVTSISTPPNYRSTSNSASPNYTVTNNTGFTLFLHTSCGSRTICPL